ncbi:MULTISPECIES: MARTX multifunctional-autoprocessing repeats-in-toxin holotoxin RtxA [Photorhabdus]|uniref:RTX toxin RtxA n=2 Tax=Photorhabdus asymbiotica TaxID=291112 RepID=A0ABX9SGV3_9GAMM|nr:MARTX multifunctional-autoprocessing repeats-in-toxin holotoxin RtxA [Photorhabdus asymbiotica]RKS54115.1 RTX toxin RtxA [Photorhabdus asymbiotica]CAQ85115.1 Similar to RTX toxin RtxA [Photorhabdus asymbiotica]CAR67542.1 Similar to RTX toxin RtxA [Photorhabdus asymbiotica subsp. asymbiotica ATCC 43949]
MGKSSNRSTEYFFTGKYYDDDDGNNIVAIGVGGEIYAKGGNDHIIVGSLGATIYASSGDKTVDGGAGYLKIVNIDGDLNVHGAAGYASIDKNGNGNISFAGAAGGVSMDHRGSRGNLNFSGAAAYNSLSRKGQSGDVAFKGIGGYNELWHETNQGNLNFDAAGAGNKIDRTWYDRYEASHGDVIFVGAGAANSISSRVESGNIEFTGAGIDNHIIRKGREGNIILHGAGASNRIERLRESKDKYEQTSGNIEFEGAGGYNQIYSDIAHGDISFFGAGGYNEISRIGEDSDSYDKALEYAKAEEIVLATAKMGANKPQQVTGIKSTIEPNTYLFAFADEKSTKISKVQLRNDPETGKLNYYATSWCKNGDQLKNLATEYISLENGFDDISNDDDYRLFNLIFEHHQPVIIQHTVEEDLQENQWVTYASGTTAKAEDVTLIDAKMHGRSIHSDGLILDVSAVKSNRRPNTYVYAKYVESYTKVVMVELANDAKTGELKYYASAWYKAGDHTGDLANEDFSLENDYRSMEAGGYSLTKLQYQVNTVRRISEHLEHTEEYSHQELVQSSTNIGDSSGDVNFSGIGGGNVIKSSVINGDVNFEGDGVANIILHSSRFGNTHFAGAGAANIIEKSGKDGKLTFRGAGLANVLVHQGRNGEMDVYAAGAANVLVRVGDGRYLAHLLAVGNISIHQGNGDSRVMMLGGYNTHTQIGNGSANWLGAGGFNVMTQTGKGSLSSVLVGGANVLTKLSRGNLVSGMLGGANIITHISSDNDISNTTAIALGGANILTKKGRGDTVALMGGGANVLTHIGSGSTTGVMLGGANILTKVGDDDTTGIMFGIGNVLTHVGDGQTLGVMAAAGNIFTKVGDGTAIAAMIGAGNIFTHVGKGDAWALMGGLGNVFTKVGDGKALALMIAAGNVFTHIGDGMSVALMLAEGNVATKVGNGMTLAAMIGEANVMTHVGNGQTFAAMIGEANILTKVGNDLTIGLMVGDANIYTHDGGGASIGLFAGELNVMTRVGDGTTLAAMFGQANIMTHSGKGLTGVLALGEANIVTKVGDGFMGVVAAAEANVVTHVGASTTAAVLLGKGNILTKVGKGTAVGLLISDVGNIMTHVGDGTTVGFAKGQANIITKVGEGTGINAVWGEANVLTQVGNGDRYNFAKGQANIITKVGGMREVTVVQGDANIITHVGNGDDYTGAWGKANIITKVGDGNNVVLAKADANIVTQVGNGDSFNALWSEGNIVTKVGDGTQVTAAKGKANITTTVGDGLSVTATHGNLNVNTKVGNGVSVNAVWGEYNVNTKVGDGLNVAIMKGKGNANIHIGDGLGFNASYARNNVAIKIGNGDFYSLSIAESNTQSNNLPYLFKNIKQTVLNVEGSHAINYLIHGDEANTSGVSKGRKAINLTEVSALDGFQMDKIDEVSSDLANNLRGTITPVETPDSEVIQNALQIGDNVGSAQDQTSPQADTVIKHAKQDKAAQNVLSDKENAEMNRQLLEQEKDKQFKAISKSQFQLESTNQDALNTNGQVQRDAISEESRMVTKELFSMTKGMDALNNYGNYDGKSGDEWRNRFAVGYLDNTQNKLNDVKLTAQEKLADARQHFINKRDVIKTALEKSEAGLGKSLENIDNADEDIADAKQKAEQRKEEALLQKQRAEKAESDANTAYEKAKQRGERDSTAAENKAAQAQKNAKSVKQADDAKPERVGATGSGLSGEAYTPLAVEKSKSHIDPASKTEADGWISEDLTLTAEDLAALNDAQQAVNRLQLNKGIRSKNTGASVTSMFTETSSGGTVESTLNQSRELTRKVPTISGIDLQGLGGNNPNSRSSVLKELELVLLNKGDKRFIDSTKRRLGAINTDRPSKALVAVREVFNSTVKQPDEQHVLQLEQALAHWQQHDPKEFAQRSKLVKSLRFEMGELVAHLQAQRAESAGILGIAVAPEQVTQFGQEVSFDGFGRVVGLKGDIAQSEINRLIDLQIKPLTQINSTAEREAPKTESESLIVFVSRLQQEAIPEGKPLIERARELWLTGQVTNEKTKELFKDAVTQLQTHPELHTLAQQLLADANKQKATGQYIDNVFGRHFDSELAYELVKTASPEAKDTAERTGNFLVQDFEQWISRFYPEGVERDQKIAGKMQTFAKAIDKDFRPWFSRVPEVTTFLDDPTFANFKTMMTKVDDGFSVIKVPFLAVKMATTPGMGMDSADWKRKGDIFYQDVITKARSTSTELTTGTDVTHKVVITEKQTNDYGTALPYQPANNKHDDFLYGRKVAAGRILVPGRETEFERNALAQGHSVVTGASGSTNIMVHLNNYIASKQPNFPTGQSYLNTLAFLVFDGGHSVNESLAVYQALQATGDERQKKLNSYTANYQDLAEIAGENGKVWVNQALDNAFKETQEFYQKYAVVKPQNRPAMEDLDGLSGKNKEVEPTIIDDSHLNKPVDGWQTVDVTPQIDGRETRFEGQIILQMEDDPIAARAAANLAGKHPDSSVVIQLDANGKYRVVYGDLSKLSNKLRWQVVGHGRETSEQNNIRLSGYSADELATKLKQFYQEAKLGEQAISKPEHISLVGCSLISDDKRDGFARHFITELDKQGIRSDVSARSSEVAVDATGRKFTRDKNNQWVNNLPDNKIVLSWDAENKLITHTEQVRRGIAESDINLSRVGHTEADMAIKGAIADNAEVFIKPQRREKVNTNDSSHNQLSYSGNIQVNVGDGEFTALNWGTSNVGIKVGTGGFKSLAYGDNNVMVHIGDGDSKHSFDLDGYQALEGAQMFIGNRNVSFNQGRSNDLIVMMDKSIPTPPLVNPFDGAARVAGVLQGIARSGDEQDWLAAQDRQWTIAGAKKFVRDISGLDQTSSVDYNTLIELDSQHERSSRGLKYDAELALNKKLNQWLGENDNSVDTSKISRADKFRQANEKLAFNFAVGGRGADIQVTAGNWNFTFGDNIQSILDTNLGSLFGLMTQQYSTTGMASTTFTYTPQDLPRQLQNKLLGRLAGVSADTTLGDIFGVDYTAEGKITSRTGELVDGKAILREMLEVISEFGGDQLEAFTNPEKLLDSLEAGINAGEDGVRTFAESHGLIEKAPDENQEQNAVGSINGESAQANSKAERAFGFNSLNLPNLFATMFSVDKQQEMKLLVTNLKENLTADLLNMKQKTFDFLRNSGHLQKDGDVHVSLGNYNFNWGGDGKDLGAYLGDNNNFWGGRGDDVYYSLGTSNIFAGGDGNDMGVLMGRENWMFGGKGDDTAVVAGRINRVFMGEGNDQMFVFGEGGFIGAGNGQDYVVTSGNYNRVDTGADQDYAVTIGNNNRVDLGEGNDFARVFGNENRIDGHSGNDTIKLMGYHAVINGGDGDDHLIAAAISKFSQFDGGDGQDLLVLGGYQNSFQGGAGVDSFVISGEVIDNQVNDINAEDMILFNGVDWKNLWFQRSGYDLVLSVNRHTQDNSVYTAQGLFESVGTVTFNDYFNGHRAKLVTQMGDKDKSGEREFTALSDNAVDSLVQAMSSFSPAAGDNGFIGSLDSKARMAVTTAWTDVTIGKGKFA